jgi:Holliday junction resolvase RusA-like endonuclease
MGAGVTWRGIIIGEPASKANQRQLVTIKGRPAFIKSKKARNYAADVARQIRPLRPLLTGPLRLTATIHYATERPDLDPSIILDALQGLVYSNDRQVREMHLFHAIDRRNPRAEIVIEPIGEPGALVKGAAA